MNLIKYILLLTVTCCVFTPGANAQTDGPAKERPAVLDCNDRNGYSLIVREPIGETRQLDILQDSEIKETIIIPTQLKVSGFALNWAKKTKKGFEISIKYGSRYYYSKRFNFVCKEGNFYLTRVRVESFDKNNPAELNKRDIKIEPNLDLRKFVIDAFMID